MATADIDINQFKPHSARSSVTAAPGLTLKEILKLGCWRQESTFRRFYEAKYIAWIIFGPEQIPLVLFFT